MPKNSTVRLVRAGLVAALAVASAPLMAATGTTSTGSITLIDASGLEYYINDNITFATTSSASGAASEASYTHAVAATTSMGGTTMSTLNDAFDGYGSVAVSTDGGGTWTSYNDNGSATLEDSGREAVFNTQTIGSLNVWRKVYVPSGDEFIRYTTFITNTGASTASVQMETLNNLGSDSNTIVRNSSSGDATVTTADSWATSMQNYSGSTSSDPRICHVFKGGSGTMGATVSAMTFVDGDDNPTWTYSVDIPAGETVALIHFASGQESIAAADAKCAELAAAGSSSAAFAAMTATEQAEVANFAVVTAPPAIPLVGPWALALLAAGLGGVGANRAVRRKQ